MTSVEYRVLFASISIFWAGMRLLGFVRNYILFIRMVLPHSRGTVAHRLISRGFFRIFLAAILDPGLAILAGMYAGFWLLGWEH